MTKTKPPSEAEAKPVDEPRSVVPSPPPSDGATKSPAEWAKQLLAPPQHWKHELADQLHGWSRHEYEEAQPLQLSQKDYAAAIVAVEANALPHRAALSKYAPLAAKLAQEQAADKEAS